MKYANLPQTLSPLAALRALAKFKSIARGANAAQRKQQLIYQNNGANQLVSQVSQRQIAKEQTVYRLPQTVRSISNALKIGDLQPD